MTHTGSRMRTLLICHAEAPLDRVGLARWLGSFSDLVGIVELHEPPKRLMRRIKREVRRVGPARFLDVVAFRAYYKAFLAARDRRWEQETLGALCDRYRAVDDVPVLSTMSPNAPEAESFIRDRSPDIVIARCKSLLKESVFALPTRGTLVMHPGVCPEYRNAHGCFWALARRDLDRVGMTLLRIDRGVDTGPVFGYYSYPFDEVNESHIVIQYRVLLENLSALEKRLVEIYHGAAEPLDTTGRTSAAWDNRGLRAISGGSGTQGESGHASDIARLPRRRFGRGARFERLPRAGGRALQARPRAVRRTR